MIYATDILLTPLMIYAISVAVLAIPMSQHALRAILQAKIQLLAPTCAMTTTTTTTTSTTTTATPQNNDVYDNNDFDAFN